MSLRRPRNAIVNSTMKQRILLLLSAISLVALLTILQVTTPIEAGPLGILIVLGLLYMSVLGGLTFLFFWASRIISRIARLLATRRPWTSITMLQAYYYASVIALAPIMIIAMTSVGASGWREFFLVGLFVLLGVIYVQRRTN